MAVEDIILPNHIELGRYLKKETPKLTKDDTDVQTINVVEVWKHSKFLCRNYILIVLSQTESFCLIIEC